MKITTTAGRVVAFSGADNFLGRSLIGVLEEDRTVRRIVAIDVQNPSTAGDKTRFYRVDLTQPGVDMRVAEILRAEEVDTFVHLAFLASPTHATAWAHELESAGTMHVLTACREHRPAKLVMWSQTLLYGPHAENPNFLTEDRPLRGLRDSFFINDKVDAEREAQRFAADAPDTVVTILRLAPMLGPTVHNFVTEWLSRRFVPTLMGYDPLLQLLHELDAIAALKLVIDRDVPGTFNIVPQGVVPVSTIVKLAGRMELPMPAGLARRVGSGLWAARLVPAPPTFLDYLRFLCVADGQRARDAMGFVPAYTTRETVLDFAGALHLRDARLLALERA